MTDDVVALLRSLPPDLPQPADRMAKVRARVTGRRRRLAMAVTALAVVGVTVPLVAVTTHIKPIFGIDRPNITVPAPTVDSRAPDARAAIVTPFIPGSDLQIPCDGSSLISYALVGIHQRFVASAEIVDPNPSQSLRVSLTVQAGDHEESYQIDSGSIVDIDVFNADYFGSLSFGVALLQSSGTCTSDNVVVLNNARFLDPPR